jgi:hypothetical protein
VGVTQFSVTGMTPLSGWQNFYVIVGSSAGALIGLQFVVMALVADRPRTAGQAQAGHAFATPNIVHFGAVLFLAAARAPWHGIGAAAVCWGLLGLGGVACPDRGSTPARTNRIPARVRGLAVSCSASFCAVHQSVESLGTTLPLRLGAPSLRTKIPTTRWRNISGRSHNIRMIRCSIYASAVSCFPTIAMLRRNRWGRPSHGTGTRCFYRMELRFGRRALRVSPSSNSFVFSSVLRLSVGFKRRESSNASRKLVSSQKPGCARRTAEGGCPHISHQRAGCRLATLARLVRLAGRPVGRSS